ncbi:MAG: STAS domain-containing protein [bacterium]
MRWINSLGIGLMLSCVKQLRENGGDLHFTGVRGRVAYYFEITKLDTELNIYENTDDALRQLTATCSV